MENQINLTVNLDDEQLKTYLTEGLNALPKEQKDQIIADGFKKYVEGHLGDIMFSKSQNYYGTTQIVLSDYAQRLLRDCFDKSEAVQEDITQFCHTVLDELKDNWEELIKEWVVQTFSNMLLNNMQQWDLEQIVGSEHFRRKH